MRWFLFVLIKGFIIINIIISNLFDFLEKLTRSWTYDTIQEEEKKRDVTSCTSEDKEEVTDNGLLPLIHGCKNITDVAIVLDVVASFLRILIGHFLVGRVFIIHLQVIFAICLIDILMHSTLCLLNLQFILLVFSACFFFFTL
ncbi:hypothetical protein ACJX0J_024960 [Zea mays]